MDLSLKPETLAKLEAHAARLGMSADKFVEVLVEREFPATEAPVNVASGVQFQKEHGLWVFRTGEPMPLSILDDTLQSLRHEREDNMLGLIPQ